MNSNIIKIFISYSNYDLLKMEEINNYLESLSFKTLIAPRDIPPGYSYPETIVNLITESDVFLLLFSENSQVSMHVNRELALAFEKNKHVIPFKLENVVLKGDMEYYISNLQWIEAYEKYYNQSLFKLSSHLDIIYRRKFENNNFCVSEVNPSEEIISKQNVKYSLKIYINYMSEDSLGEARSLYISLKEAYGAENIFFFPESNSIGDRFKLKIDHALEVMDIFMPLIGPKFLTAADAKGNIRLFDPSDLVRLEIEYALAHNKIIIPIVIGEAPFPTVDQLPESLAKLADLEIHRMSFMRDYEFSLEVLKKRIQKI